jgi:hypothetical protein
MQGGVKTGAKRYQSDENRKRGRKPEDLAAVGLVSGWKEHVGR